MAIPVYSDIDIRGKLTAKGSMETEGKLTAKGALETEGKLTAKGELETASGMQFTDSGATIVKPINITSTIKNDDYETKELTISLRDLPSGEGDSKEFTISFEELGSISKYEVTYEGPESMYNSDSMFELIDSSKKHIEYLLEYRITQNKIVLEISVEFKDYGFNISAVSGNSVKFIITAFQTPNAIQIDCGIAAERIFTGSSKYSIDDRLITLEDRLAALGFNGGYGIYATCVALNESNTTRKEYTNMLIGYIARLGKIEYGYIWDGNSIQNNYGDVIEESYRIIDIKDVSIQGANPNPFVGPANNSEISITWLGIQYLSNIDKLITPTVKKIKFQRSNGKLAINAEDDISYTEWYVSPNQICYSYFAWSTDGNFEPNNTK